MQKPLSWFALQLNWVISLWYEFFNSRAIFLIDYCRVHCKYICCAAHKFWNFLWAHVSYVTAWYDSTVVPQIWLCCLCRAFWWKHGERDFIKRVKKLNTKNEKFKEASILRGWFFLIGTSYFLLVTSY